MIDFGQLGDVILSLPALSAIAAKFPDAKISAVVGSPCAEIVRMQGLFDEVIPVDRVELLVSSKIWSVIQILKLLRRIRQKKFDFVIDLHSLPETNLLGYFSGAKTRLFANRESRSIDFLSNFRPKPPLEDKHTSLSLCYLNVLLPLGIEKTKTKFVFRPRSSDIDFLAELFESKGVGNEVLIGLYPGAGHPSRRWNLSNFCQLTEKLLKVPKNRVILFLGPEEKSLLEEIRATFPGNVIVLDTLNIPQLAAAFSLISILVSNDTGPMHLAAIVDVPIVLLLNEALPPRYFPIAEKLIILRRPDINDIKVSEVIEAVSSIIS